MAKVKENMSEKIEIQLSNFSTDNSSQIRLIYRCLFAWLE